MSGELAFTVGGIPGTLIVEGPVLTLLRFVLLGPVSVGREDGASELK